MLILTVRQLDPNLVNLVGLFLECLFITNQLLKKLKVYDCKISNSYGRLF